MFKSPSLAFTRLRDTVTLFCLVILIWASIEPLEGAYILRKTIIAANGAISYTGNTVGLNKLAGQNQPGTADAIGAFITTDSSQQVGAYPFSTTTPAGTTLTWQNNSSAAILDLPAGSSVLYAELIWSGSYGFNGQIPYVTPGTFIPYITPVTLITPQLQSYNVSPDPATNQVAVTPGFVAMGNYVVSSDVTSIIQEGGAGSYSVGGVPGTISALDDTHNAANWTLAVLYSNPNMLTSNLSIFVGCEQASVAVIPATASGFCAPPSGEISARLFVSATEGDANKTGDHLLFGPTPTLSYPANAVSGTNNPVNNFFASQVNTLLPLIVDPLTGKLMAVGSSQLDTSGSYGNVNGNAIAGTNTFAGRQGLDITSVDVSSLISNNQTAASALGTTTGDDYTISSLAMQIQVGAPIVQAFKQVNGLDSIISLIGDTVTYNITLENSGTGDAFNTVFTDPLQTGLSFVSGSFVLNGLSNPGIVGSDLVTGIPLGDLMAATMSSPAGTATIEFKAKINSYPLIGDTYFNHGVVNYDFIPCQSDIVSLVTDTNIVSIVILPIANPDFGTTPENTPLNGSSVLTNDIGNGLSVVSYTQSSQGGTVIVNPDGTYFYTPPLNFVGTDTFTYTAQDSSGNLVTATVTITVTPNPPLGFKGTITECKFINKTEYTLNAKWKPSKSPYIVSYRIYYRGKVVATIPANTSPLEVQLCLPSKKAGYRYKIAAVSSTKQESPHMQIKIIHE